MRIFQDGNWEHPDSVCPICGTNKPGPVILIPVPHPPGQKVVQARQYHVDCVQLEECYLSSTKTWIFDGFDDIGTRPNPEVPE